MNHDAFANHNVSAAERHFQIRQLETPEQFEPLQPGIRELLGFYQDILADDFCDVAAENANHPNQRLEQLTTNTRSCMPWLWIITDQAGRVLAIAALGQVTPGRHAYLHGVAHPLLLTQRCCSPALINQLANRVLTLGFETLGLIKIKAEFEADNRGALGFCRRMGFTREAHFRQDNRVGGLLKDVVVYSLFAERFFERKKAQPALPKGHRPKPGGG